MTRTPWSYDAIAEIYADDMGRNMPFDDVAWYRDLCLAQSGRVLELGCGTGRILLELIAAGVDAAGIDRSLPMLTQLAREARRRRLAPRGLSIAQMDLRSLCLSGAFGLILAPYSLLTYLTQPAQATALLGQLRALLAADGRLVLDAFVPQPVSSFADFTLDYRRARGGGGEIERRKRISIGTDGCHRIERLYRLYDAAGRPGEEIITSETIRPYRAEELAAMACQAGLRPLESVWDYGSRAGAEGARFASLIVGRGGGAP